MGMWLVFLTLILLTIFSQRGSLVSGGDQWANHVPHGCSRLISISRRWGWARHLPGGWPDGSPSSTDGEWTQRCAALPHSPIPDLYCCSDHFRNLSQLKNFYSLTYVWKLNEDKNTGTAFSMIEEKHPSFPSFPLPSRLPPPQDYHLWAVSGRCLV